MRITNKSAVHSILLGLQHFNVKHIVYSPGSRNAPFAISLQDNEAFDVHIVVDERSAGFIALGMAQQLKTPVALICTSGTAPLNYAPAIAEAYYQEIPLIVITADRPQESIHQSEGQCIDQKGIYDHFSKASVSLSEEAIEDQDLIENHHLIFNTMAASMQFPKGPVHINVPFQEPLYKTQSSLYPVLENQLWSNPSPNKITEIPKWDENKKYLFIMGQNEWTYEWREAVAGALTFSNITVMSESHGNAHGLGAIDQIDRWIMSLTEKQKEEWQWDVVVSIGHNVISRKVKALIREKCAEHWSLQFQSAPINTYRKNPLVLNVDAISFLKGFLKEAVAGSMKNEHHLLNELHKSALDEYLESRPHSDLKVFYHLSKALPLGCQVQMGNSSVVRYIQLMDQRGDLRYFGNRGVSGIDGCTSTAVGASWVSQERVVLVTGDLSFLYDANGLWMKTWPRNLKVVIIDNGGGGIFRIIDGAKDEISVPTFFESPHERDIKKWIEGWGWSVASFESIEEEDFKDFFDHDSSQILIVKTPSELNPIELDLFFNYFKKYNERVENN